MAGCGASDTGGSLRLLLFFAQLHSPVAQHRPGPPDLQQQEERAKADQRADDVREISTQGGSSASTATIFPTEADSANNGKLVTAASAIIGAPNAPYETGALLAMAATRSASNSATPRTTRIGATTAQG